MSSVLDRFSSPIQKVNILGYDLGSSAVRRLSNSPSIQDEIAHVQEELKRCAEEIAAEQQTIDDLETKVKEAEENVLADTHPRQQYWMDQVNYLHNVQSKRMNINNTRRETENLLKDIEKNYGTKRRGCTLSYIVQALAGKQCF